MGCRNCHTVMMETDAACPSCHASAASATAATPGGTDGASNLLRMLPVFGGALGGLAYAALAASCRTTPPGSPHGQRETSGSGAVKWIFGLLLMLGGGLFLMLALVHFLGTWRIARREPKVLAAAELCRMEDIKSAPAWIAYTFTESKPTELTITRRRLGQGGDVQARCLLARVEDKWLVASVAPGFEGNRLVGRLLPVDSSSSPSLIEQVRNLQWKPFGLLPYEFNAVDGSASDQRLRYAAAAWIAVFGLAALFLGLHLFRSGRRQAHSPSAPAATGWTYHPLPNG